MHASGYNRWIQAVAMFGVLLVAPLASAEECAVEIYGSPDNGRPIQIFAFMNWWEHQTTFTFLEPEGCVVMAREVKACGFYLPTLTASRGPMPKEVTVTRNRKTWKPRSLDNTFVWLTNFCAEGKETDSAPQVPYPRYLRTYKMLYSINS